MTDEILDETKLKKVTTIRVLILIISILAFAIIGLIGHISGTSSQAIEDAKALENSNKEEIHKLKEVDEAILGFQNLVMEKFEGSDRDISEIKGSVLTIESDIKILIGRDNTQSRVFN